MALLATTDGLPVGSYYEGQHDLPIYVKSVGQDNQRLGKLGNVPVWSLVPSTNLLNMETIKELISGMISADELLTAAIGSTPLNQATNGINAVWEVPVVRRYNGQRSISAQCNNAPGYTSNEVRNSLLTKIDTIQFPPGYTTEWQGEYLASTQSKQYLFKNVPVAIVLVLAILIALLKISNVRR